MMKDCVDAIRGVFYPNVIVVEEIFTDITV